MMADVITWNHGVHDVTRYLKKTRSFLFRVSQAGVSLCMLYLFVAYIISFYLYMYYIYIWFLLVKTRKACLVRVAFKVFCCQPMYH